MCRLDGVHITFSYIVESSASGGAEGCGPSLADDLMSSIIFVNLFLNRFFEFFNHHNAANTTTAIAASYLAHQPPLSSTGDASRKWLPKQKMETAKLGSYDVQSQIIPKNNNIQSISFCIADARNNFWWRHPLKEPTYSMPASTIFMPCNDSGYHSVSEAVKYGIVDYVRSLDNV